jgi:hypothetical protein
VAVAVLGGCSGAPQTPTFAPERLWIENAAGFIDSLGDGVLLSANGGVNLASARIAIRNESDIYAMLVAYTRFGECDETLVNVGTPNRRVRGVERTLTAACRRFERAATLFTLAMTRSDPSLLLVATRTSLKTSPLLYRARAQLDAVRGSLG